MWNRGVEEALTGNFLRGVGIVLLEATMNTNRFYVCVPSNFEGIPNANFRFTIQMP